MSALAVELSFRCCGPVLLVGGGRPDLLPALQASAEEVILVVPPWREAGLVHDLESAGVPVTVPEVEKLMRGDGSGRVQR